MFGAANIILNLGFQDQIRPFIFLKRNQIREELDFISRVT